MAAQGGGKSLVSLRREADKRRHSLLFLYVAAVAVAEAATQVGLTTALGGCSVN